MIQVIELFDGWIGDPLIFKFVILELWIIYEVDKKKTIVKFSYPNTTMKTNHGFRPTFFIYIKWIASLYSL